MGDVAQGLGVLGHHAPADPARHRVLAPLAERHPVPRVEGFPRDCAPLRVEEEISHGIGIQGRSAVDAAAGMALVGPEAAESRSAALGSYDLTENFWEWAGWNEMCFGVRLWFLSFLRDCHRICVGARPNINERGYRSHYLASGAMPSALNMANLWSWIYLF